MRRAPGPEAAPPRVSPYTQVELGGDLAAALARRARRGPGSARSWGRKAATSSSAAPRTCRRWAATHLGLGRPVPKGKRPPTDLSPIATAVAFAESTSAFHQRLLFERLMERHVPRAKRRDLKPPVVPSPRPRARGSRASRCAGRTRTGPTPSVPSATARPPSGPATRSTSSGPLRPCDYVFEPDPQLALGLGCLYAQVRSCAAPCLSRVSEDGYRAPRPRRGRRARRHGAPARRRSRPSCPISSRRRDREASWWRPTRRRWSCTRCVAGAVLEERGGAPRARPRPRAAATGAARGGAWLGLPLRRLVAPLPDDLPWLLQWILGPGGAAAIWSCATRESAPRPRGARARGVNVGASSRGGR